MAPEKRHTFPSSLERVYPPTLAFRRLLVSRNLLFGWVVPCLCLHWLLQEPHDAWLRWGIQELDFESSLGFLIYPARPQVVEKGALADEEFLLSSEPSAAGAPPQSSTGHMYHLCLPATRHMDTTAAGTSWRKLDENTKVNRNHQAFMVLLLTHWHPGSSSDATKGKKGDAHGI